MVNVVHQTSNEFPMDRSFYGQTFVIGNHVQYSALPTAVVSSFEYRGKEEPIGELQKRIAAQRFNTQLLTQDRRLLKPGSETAEVFRKSEQHALLQNLTSQGKVALAFHYFSDRGYPEIAHLKREFGESLDVHLHLHCLASLFFGDLNKAELTQKQRNMRDKLHKVVADYNPRFIAVSDAVRDSFYQHGIIPEGAPVHVVRNGVSSDLYKRASLDEKTQFRKELGIPASKLVGYVGRLDADIKGSGNLLEILASFDRKNTDVGFVIATPGGYDFQPFLHALSERAPRLVAENRVKLCLDVSKFTRGFYSKDSDVARHFYKVLDQNGLFKSPLFRDIVTVPVQPHLDAYLHPVNSEAISLSVVEAALSEVPVVASRIGGIPEVVNPHTGTLVDVKGRQLFEYVPEFVQALEHHLTTPQKTEFSSIVRENLIRDGFDAASMAHKLDSLYLSHK